MTRVIDKLLLLLYSLAVLAAAIVVLLSTTGVATDMLNAIQYDALRDSSLQTSIVIGVSAIVALISFRFLYISLRVSGGRPSSIDQRTDFGDIRISLETVENLTLKAASRVKGVKDLKVRVTISEAGLELTIRSVVDGDLSIPTVTEDVQRAVKQHVEEATGVPVSDVSVYIANIIQSQTFKSRVE